MATVNFRLRSRAKKEVSIFVYLSITKVFLIEAKTNFVIHPDKWSFTKKKAKDTDDILKKLNSDLAKLKNYLIDKYNEDQGTAKIVFDKEWLKTEIENCFNRVVSDDKSLVVNRYQYIIDNASTRKIKGTSRIGLSSSRIKSYKNSKAIFEEYQTVIKKQIHFVQIDKSFVDGFTTWLFDVKKYAISHCNKQLVDLKGVAKDAEEYDIQIHPYVKKIEGFTENSEDKFIVTLSFEELEILKTVELKREALKNARKWMLLGCNIGQRGGDLLKITKVENVRYDAGNIYIDVIQDKSKSEKSITVSIMDNYLVEMIENDNMPYQISDQKLNEYIKEVCKIAKINVMTEGKKWDTETKRKKLGIYPKHELVTNHSFRRSFASNYYKLMPTPVLMEITGHSKESTFLVYINKKQDKDSNANLFREYWEKIHENKEPQMKVSKSKRA